MNYELINRRKAARGSLWGGNLYYDPKAKQLRAQLQDAIDALYGDDVQSPLFSTEEQIVKLVERAERYARRK